MIMPRLALVLILQMLLLSIAVFLRLNKASQQELHRIAVFSLVLAALSGALGILEHFPFVGVWLLVGFQLLALMESHRFDGTQLKRYEAEVFAVSMFVLGTALLISNKWGLCVGLLTLEYWALALLILHKGKECKE